LVAQRLGFKSGVVVFTPKDGGEGHAICWVDLNEDKKFSEKEIIDLTTHDSFGELRIKDYLSYYAYRYGGCKVQLAGTGRKGELETIYPTSFASQLDGGIKTIKDFNFEGKRVVIRVDYNLPVEVEFDKEGNVTEVEITDAKRIKESLPTLIHILKENPQYILLITHFEPKVKLPTGKKEKINLSTEIIAQALKDILPQEYKEKVVFLPESVNKEGINEEAIATIKEGKEKIFFLENIRFAKGEKKNSKDLREQLSELADIYIIDAFGAIHRAHASLMPLTPNKGIGLLVEKEIEHLSKVFNPRHPFVAIFGGAKIEDKVDIIKTFLEIMEEGDKFLIGGAMAYTFLKAKDPQINLGNSLIEESKIDLAREILKEAEDKGIEILLPQDHVAATELSSNAQLISTQKEIPQGFMGVDIGEETIAQFKKALENAQTVIWNGPLGVFEKKQGGFIKGTESIAQILKDLSSQGKDVIIGGGDTAKAVKEAGLKEDEVFISTGGGATLEFLATKGNLPVLKNLKDDETSFASQVDGGINKVKDFVNDADVSCDIAQYPKILEPTKQLLTGLLEQSYQLPSFGKTNILNQKRTVNPTRARVLITGENFINISLANTATVINFTISIIERAMNSLRLFVNIGSISLTTLSQLLRPVKFNLSHPLDQFEGNLPVLENLKDGGESKDGRGLEKRSDNFALSLNKLPILKNLRKDKISEKSYEYSGFIGLVILSLLTGEIIDDIKKLKRRLLCMMWSKKLELWRLLILLKQKVFGLFMHIFQGLGSTISLCFFLMEKFVGFPVVISGWSFPRGFRRLSGERLKITMQEIYNFWKNISSWWNKTSDLFVNSLPKFYKLFEGRLGYLSNKYVLPPSLAPPADKIKKLLCPPFSYIPSVFIIFLPFIRGKRQTLSLKSSASNYENNNFDGGAILKRTSQGIKVEFSDEKISKTPSWYIAGYEFYFAKLKPFISMPLNKNFTHYVKVLRGRLRRPSRGILISQKKRSLLVEEDEIQAGEEGAIVAVFVRKGSVPQRVDNVNNFLVKSPEGAELEWKHISEMIPDDPEFATKDMYYTRPQILIEGYRFNFWYAGPYVHCGIHNHSQEPVPFKEIHLNLIGTKGGMVKYAGTTVDTEIERIILLPGEEHGPFWTIKEEKVFYGWHAWEAGEDGNLWVVFEDVKITSNDSSRDGGISEEEKGKILYTLEWVIEGKLKNPDDAWVLWEDFGAKAVEVLIEELGTDNIFRWNIIVDILVIIGNSTVAELSIKALENKDWRIRQRAVKVLGKIGYSKAKQPLLKALKDEEWPVRKEAVYALGSFGGKDVEEALVERLRDESEDVRRAATHVLGKLILIHNKRETLSLKRSTSNYENNNNNFDGGKKEKGGVKCYLYKTLKLIISLYQSLKKSSIYSVVTKKGGINFSAFMITDWLKPLKREDGRFLINYSPRRLLIWLKSLFLRAPPLKSTISLKSLLAKIKPYNINSHILYSSCQIQSSDDSYLNKFDKEVFNFELSKGLSNYCVEGSDPLGENPTKVWAISLEDALRLDLVEKIEGDLPVGWLVVPVSLKLKNYIERDHSSIKIFSIQRIGGRTSVVPYKGEFIKVKGASFFNNEVVDSYSGDDTSAKGALLLEEIIDEYYKLREITEGKRENFLPQPLGVVFLKERIFIRNNKGDLKEAKIGIVYTLESPYRMSQILNFEILRKYNLLTREEINSFFENIAKAIKKIYQKGYYHPFTSANNITKQGEIVDFEMVKEIDYRRHPQNKLFKMIRNVLWKSSSLDRFKESFDK